jgi:hypothetical protein
MSLKAEQRFEIELLHEVATRARLARTGLSAAGRATARRVRPSDPAAGVRYGP